MYFVGSFSSDMNFSRVFLYCVICVLVSNVLQKFKTWFLVLVA
jgi:hypothetical protein